MDYFFVPQLFEEVGDREYEDLGVAVGFDTGPGG